MNGNGKRLQRRVALAEAGLAGDTAGSLGWASAEVSLPGGGLGNRPRQGADRGSREVIQI